jgi:hypothetical protein
MYPCAEIYDEACNEVVDWPVVMLSSIHWAMRAAIQGRRREPAGGKDPGKFR